MVIFSNNTLLSDIVQADYKNVPIETFKHLKKDTLCDLVEHLINENKILDLNFNADIMIQKMSTIINKSLSQIKPKESTLKGSNKCSDESELMTDGKLDKIQREVSTVLTQVSNIENDMLTDKTLSKPPCIVNNHCHDNSTNDQCTENDTKEIIQRDCMSDINEKIDRMQEDVTAVKQQVCNLNENLTNEALDRYSQARELLSNPTKVSQEQGKEKVSDDITTIKTCVLEINSKLNQCNATAKVMEPTSELSPGSDPQNTEQETSGRACNIYNGPETLRQITVKLDRQGEVINKIKTVTESSISKLDSIETKIDNQGTNIATIEDTTRKNTTHIGKINTEVEQEIATYSLAAKKNCIIRIQREFKLATTSKSKVIEYQPKKTVIISK